ncbi:hypothetical protein UFOVP75_108 [uncultured Caudovirales phage]|uniref:Uncharacterized protein n=1 Tax=uncultured Caudovirales phage TaxID=2100421 RepID=A0A6J5KYX8_9CAUD|nr:hypothetical protein UFOVP75_108 [uncultured Caudovirales phage]
MNQTSLKSITFQSFRSIVGPVKVSFPRQGLVLVKAKNLDTKGSSGAGKTSLLTGVNYVFGCSPFSANSLQSWNSEIPMQMTLEMDTKEGHTVLSRGKSTSIVTPVESISGKVSAVEQKLQSLLGVNPTLLKALTYRKQKSTSLFLSMGDSEKKEFLSSVLGLDRFEALADDAARLAKTYETEMKAQQSAVLTIQTMLTGRRDALLTPAPLDVRDLENTIGALEGEVAEARALLSALQGEYDALQSVFKTIAPPIAAKYAPLEKALEDEIAAIQAEPIATDLKRLNDLKNARAVCRQRLSAATAEVQKLIDAQNAQRRIWEKEKNAAVAKSAGLGKIRRQLDDLRVFIAKLEEAECPTCLRPWEDHASAMKKEESIATLKNLLLQETQAEEGVVELEAIEARLRELQPIDNAAVRSLETMSSRFDKEIAQEEGVIASATKMVQLEKNQRLSIVLEKQKELRNAKTLETSEKTSEVSQKLAGIQSSIRNQHEHVRLTQTSIDRAKAEINSLTKHFETQAAVHAAAIKMINNDEAALAKAVALKDTATASWKAEVDFGALVGREGFLSGIFDEVLLEIASETNDILASVPNTAHAVLRFVSETVSDKGNVKKSIKPVVSLAGRDVPWDSGLSGGQDTSTQLAVDLAVIEVLGRRTGSLPGWLILDEPFDGLGVVEKEACLEILQKYAQNRLVLVVDHATEVQEMFDSVIELEFSNGVTTVKQ